MIHTFAGIGRDSMEAIPIWPVAPKTSTLVTALLQFAPRHLNSESGQLPAR